MDTHSSRNNTGFVALETIAITVIIVLVVVVTIAIVLMPEFTERKAGSSDPTFKAPVDTLPKNTQDIALERRDIKYVPPEGPYDPNYQPEKSFNEKQFDEIITEMDSQGGERGGINSVRFTGEIIDISQNGDLRITLESRLGGLLYGHEVEYVFRTEDASKVTFEGTSLTELKPGTTIHIDQTFDYSKSTYTESLQSVSISIL